MKLVFDPQTKITHEKAVQMAIFQVQDKLIEQDNNISIDSNTGKAIIVPKEQDWSLFSIASMRQKLHNKITQLTEELSNKQKEIDQYQKALEGLETVEKLILDKE